MEIHFDWEGRSGLRILDEFISGQMIEVQGLNGVGKSAAAQLLEIATGQHIFRRASEFESLKRSLIDASIVISGLENQCQTITAKLTPSRWQLDSDYRIQPATIGTFQVDGSPANHDKVWSLLSSRTIRGNDTIVSQMIEVLIRNREDLDKYIAGALSNLDQIDGIYQKLLTISTPDDLATYRRAQDSVEHSREVQASLKAEIGELEKILDNLEPILEIDRQINELTEADIPSLSQRIQTIRLELDQNDSAQATIRGQIETLQQSVTAQEAVNQAQIATQLVKIETVQAQEFALKSQLIQQLNEAKLEVPTTELLQLEQQLYQADFDISKEIEDLRNRSSEAQKNLILSDLGSGLVYRILPDIEHGLGEEIIASGPLPTVQHADISLTDLEKMLNIRLTELEALMIGEGGDVYAESIDRLGLRREAVINLRRTARSLRRRSRMLAVMYERLDEVQTGEASRSTATIRELNHELQGLRQFELGRRIDLRNMEGALERVAAYPSLSDLQSKLDAGKSSLGITDDIESVHQNYVGKLSGAKVRLDPVQQELKDSVDLLDATERRLQAQLQVVLRDNAIKRLLPKNVDDDVIHIMEMLHTSMRRLLDNSDTVANRITQVRNAISEMIDNLQEKATPTEASAPIIDVLRELYNGYFVSVYQQPEFLKYIFRDFESVVRFDMGANDVILRSKGGEEIIRPLGAFSSGEKAFAFSLAMITLTSRQKSANRILVLDEFSALLDYERADVLRRHLRRNVTEQQIADKVIVILPAREDLNGRITQIDQGLKTGVGDPMQLKNERKRLLSQASSLASKGYFQFAWNGSR